MLSWIIVFFLDVCFCLFFVAFVIVFSFLFVLHVWPKFYLHAAALTAIVELIIRKITVSLLLTLTIVYYSRELPVQEIFIEQLSIEH